MSELAEVRQTMTEILRRMDLLVGTMEPDLTITAFAKRANLSRSTVYDRISSRQILTRHGRIPAKELRKVAS